MSLNDFTIGIMSEQDWQTETKDSIATLKELVKETNTYDKETIASAKADIDTNELSLKYNINLVYYYNEYWKINALEEIRTAKNDIYLGKDVEKNEKFVNGRVSALDKDDYNEYLELIKKEEKEKLENKDISEEQYNNQIYLLNLREKYEIYKEPSEEILGWKESTYEDISTMKEALRTGINTTTGKLLKLEETTKLQDNIKMAEYRLENNIPNLDSTSSERGLYDGIAPEFSMIVVAILMIIIAGSSISTEISKGTIKFLLFTPNKRWKVLLSKIISAILILLVLTIILSLLSVVVGNILFEDAGSKYVYISNGEVHSLPNIVYTVLYFLSYSIDVLVYMIFAFMLSCITRNTALSVGVSIACYVGSGIVMNIINYYITADWVKYIPFNNLRIGR